MAQLSPTTRRPAPQGVRPSAGNATLPVAVGVGVTFVIFFTVSTLLLSIALGGSDYLTGRTGGMSGRTLVAAAAVVALVATAVGTRCVRILLTLQDVDPRGVARIAGVGPAVVVLLFALDGLLGGGRPIGALALVVAAVLGIVLGLRLPELRLPDLRLPSKGYGR